MTDRYRARRLFRDSQTLLVIPNLKITAMDAVINIVSSYVTNPIRSSKGFFTDKFDKNPFSSLDNFVTGLMTRIIDLLTVGLGVTKLETSQEYTMPFSKGIGSTGEVIHLLGAKNEMINLTFKTDRYPGRLGYVLRAMLQKVLETAQVVYLLDDLFLATPCLIKKTKLSKEGLYRGVVMGELELVSLTTGGSFMDDTLGGKDKVKGLAGKLKKGASTQYNRLTGDQQLLIEGVGGLMVAGALLKGIFGGGYGG